MTIFALSGDTIVSSTTRSMPLPPLGHTCQLASATQSPAKRRKVPEPVSPLGTSASKSSSSRPNMTASSSITLDMLRPHFEEPLAKVAASFGICVTLLKKICRRHGIARWPHRQITGLRKSIASMEHAIGYFDGARRESYAEQLLKQKNKLAALLEDPTTNNPLLITEEDQGQQNTKRQPNVLLKHDAVAPAVTACVSSPTGPLFVESPFDGVSPETTTLPLQASPIWLPSIEPGYTQLYRELCPPSTMEQTCLKDYSTSNYYPFSGSSSGATSPIQLPPLRSESRGLLPPISSLVVNNNKSYTSAASW